MPSFSRGLGRVHHPRCVIAILRRQMWRCLRSDARSAASLWAAMTSPSLRSQAMPCARPRCAHQRLGLFGQRPQIARVVRPRAMSPDPAWSLRRPVWIWPPLRPDARKAHRLGFHQHQRAPASARCSAADRPVKPAPTTQTSVAHRPAGAEGPGGAGAGGVVALGRRVRHGHSLVAGFVGQAGPLAVEWRSSQGCA